MTKAERARLTNLAQTAVASIGVDRPALRARAERIAGRYSPTSLERFRQLSEVVWWLAAIGADEDAIRLSDALCEVHDEVYWMFQALGSAFATRAFLHRRCGRIGQSEADARSARDWLRREPNYRPPTKKEVNGALARFRGWLARAEAERSPLAAAQVLAHALRVLVIYEQLSVCGVPAAAAIPASAYSEHLQEGLGMLRRRIEAWSDA